MDEKEYEEILSYLRFKKFPELFDARKLQEEVGAVSTAHRTEEYCCGD
jgi:hypothetical protein